MTNSINAAAPMLSVRERIIVALDVETAAEARLIVEELRGNVGAFKVGLQLFSAGGPEFVRELTGSGEKVFLDLKFHDIPNTVAKAAVEAARLGVWMFNVHAMGGSEMMRAVIKEVDAACENGDLKRPLVIAVTVLTSSDNETLAEVGIGGPVDEEVIRLAKLAAGAGMDGVVASPLEAAAIKAAAGKEFVAVTPGIRPLSATGDDQKRVTTVGRALGEGSDYVVIGRPITQAADRMAALDAIVAEAEQGIQ